MWFLFVSYSSILIFFTISKLSYVCFLCRFLAPSMLNGGPSDVGEHVGSKRASTWPNTMSMHERQEVSEHEESKHSQDIQGSANRPSWRSEAPPQLDPIVLMATLTAF